MAGHPASCYLLLSSMLRPLSVLRTSNDKLGSRLLPCEILQISLWQQKPFTIYVSTNKYIYVCVYVVHHVCIYIIKPLLWLFLHQLILFLYNICLILLFPLIQKIGSIRIDNQRIFLYRYFLILARTMIGSWKILLKCFKKIKD